MIANILNGLANSPTIYGATVVFLSSLSALLAVLPALPPALRRSRFASTAFFFLVGAITVLVGRWPSMRYDDSISVDEAQMLAQALTLSHYPIPWKFYDPTTSGPLNSAVLDLPRLIGLFPNVRQQSADRCASHRRSSIRSLRHRTAHLRRTSGTTCDSSAPRLFLARNIARVHGLSERALIAYVSSQSRRT